MNFLFLFFLYVQQFFREKRVTFCHLHEILLDYDSERRR